MRPKETPRRKIWETVYQRFDPERPPQDPAWHVPREQRSMKSVLRALDRPHASPRILLPGTIGTGKTTELQHLALGRASSEFVVVLDLDRHFQEIVGDPAALLNVSSWEVCFLAALYILREAKARLGFDLPDQHIKDLERNWARLAQAAGETTSAPQIDLGKALSTLLGVASKAAPLAGPKGAAAAPALKAASAAAATVRWQIPMGLGRKAVSDQDAAVQSMVIAVNIALNLVRAACPEQRILLVIDGLDKIQDIERATELFISSRLIAQLECCLLVACPFALRHHASLSTLGFTKVPPLMNEPVMLQEDPSRRGPGITFFCDLFGARVKDLKEPDSLIPRASVEELAYYSGGRARDFVKFVRVLSELAWDEDAETATKALVDEALDDIRRERELGIHRGHIKLLRTVMEDPEHRSPDEPLTRELFQYSLLLPYSNGSEWFYPHPLLQIHMLRPTSGGSGGSSGTSS